MSHMLSVSLLMRTGILSCYGLCSVDCALFGRVSTATGIWGKYEGKSV